MIAKMSLRLRVIRLPLLVGLLLLFSPSHGWAQSITVNIVDPGVGAIVGNELAVAATVQSVYEVRSVTAQVESREASLVFSECAYRDRWGCHPGWAGILQLSGLARGEKVLTVTATDVYGGTGQAQRNFVYDQPASLTVQEPQSESVARPVVHLVAQCTDDDPMGCSSITVYATGTTVIAAGTSNIDTLVSLKAYDGTAVTLRFEAKDSVGQVSRQERTVYVESSLRLTEVDHVDGRILDVQPTRILFLDASGTEPVLKLRDRTTRQDTVIPGVPKQTPQYGFLTPKGAMFVTMGADVVLEAGVYDWRDGQLVRLGFPDSLQSLVVKGNYAIWNTGELLFLRDLLSGTNEVVSSDAGNWMNDVATNGDVVYWAYWPNYTVYRYRGGTTTQLTHDQLLWNTYPVTDGTSVVYRKHTPCCGGQTYAIVMYRAGGEETLAPARSQEPNPGPDYQVNNGWTAFTRLGPGGQLQVWTRSPGGTATQVSFFGADSRIGALGPNGEVTFTSNRRMYLANPGAPPTDIASNLGRGFWQDGQLFVIIGRTLFGVSTGPVLGLDLNDYDLHQGEQLTLTATVSPGLTPVTADAYVAVQLPDGSLLFLQGDGSLTWNLQPIVRNWTISPFTGQIFAYTFSGGEPVGNYAWLAAFTQPGTLNFIGPIVSAPFSFSP